MVYLQSGYDIRSMYNLPCSKHVSVHQSIVYLAPPYSFPSLKPQVCQSSLPWFNCARYTLPSIQLLDSCSAVKLQLRGPAAHRIDRFEISVSIKSN